MDVIVLVARIVFAILFLVSAVGHFAQADGMTGYAQARGVPAARFAVLAGGVMLAAGGLSLLFGLWGDIGALLLVVFLVPTAVLMHGFWKETDATAKTMEQVQFLKDSALAGAALGFFALFAYAGTDLGLTLTDAFFSLD